MQSLMWLRMYHLVTLLGEHELLCVRVNEVGTFDSMASICKIPLTVKEQPSVLRFFIFRIFCEAIDTLYDLYFHFCCELALETWTKDSSINSLLGS